MSIGVLLIIVGLLIWLLTSFTTLAIILAIIGIILLIAPNFSGGRRRWYW